MPRKKKVETVKVKEVIKDPIRKCDYGSGMTRVNNMLAAGFSLEEIREVKKNE